MDPPAGRADMDHMNHAEPYDDTYLEDILSSVKTIAMVEMLRARYSPTRYWTSGSDR